MLLLLVALASLLPGCEGFALLLSLPARHPARPAPSAGRLVCRASPAAAESSAWGGSAATPRLAFHFSAAAAGLLAMGAGAGAGAEEGVEEYKLVKILKDCSKQFGVVRFITVSPAGAVQESLGRLDYSRVPFELPVGKNKGQWVRLAGPKSSEKYMASFKCSINLSKAAYLSFDTLRGPYGPLYTMRITDLEGEKITTILLNYDIDGNGGKPGKYPDGAVEHWEEMLRKWGDRYGAVSLLE
mmetsp:Transcript_48707/g.121643  ORF Transcript_48707/g.121643 Transcript_48707/m.121643 type:complete len:242 (+) Transcript_48707:34-759(+)